MPAGPVQPARGGGRDTAAGPTPVLVVGTHSVHVRRVVAGLCAAGHPVVLMTGPGERLLDHPLLLEQTAVDFGVRALGTAGRIRACIQQWRPRLVHAHQANSVAWHAARACRASGTRLLLTLWGSDVLLLPQRGLLERRMVRYALRSAAAWTADAAEVLRAARALAAEDRPAALVVMGVDQVPADLAAVWREKEGRALSCRLHKPLYRVDAIVRAFAATHAAHPERRLEVAATGSETAALQRMAEASAAPGAIEFTGYLPADRLAQSYRRAQVYVSFPLSDGTSVSLLEAMAQGCVPVVSDLPANREWIVDGLNGVVVARPDDLPQALDRAFAVAASPAWRETMAPANLQLVRDKALFADSVGRYMALYQELAP